MNKILLIPCLIVSLAAFSSDSLHAQGANVDSSKSAIAPAGNVSAKTGTNSRTPMGIDSTRQKSSTNSKTNMLRSANPQTPCVADGKDCITPGQRDPETAKSQTPSNPTAPSGDTKTEHDKPDATGSTRDSDSNSDADNDAED
ncbi:MAG: hypothetical protein V4691_10640 [Pseudomonadota bacterium]